MATSIHRYKLIGPTMDMLGDLVPTVVIINNIINCEVIDIQVDDQYADDLDEAMADYGYAPKTGGGGGVPPTYGIKSPDGSIWYFTVDNTGAMTMVKKT